MRAILVPVEAYGNRTSTLEAALLLARKFNSYIEGIALRRNTLAMGVGDFGGRAVADFVNSEEEWLKRARVLFEKFMQYHDVRLSTKPNACVSYGWREFVPPSNTFVGIYGRIFDLTVWTAPQAGDRNSAVMLQASLFQSGRPILVVPKLPIHKLGEKVLIVWNGDIAESRAIGFAMPILQQAKEVTIVTSGKYSLHSPTGEQVLRYLERNGICARLNAVGPKGAMGADILATAECLGCDLLIKGTPSGLWEKFFRGPTRRILEDSRLPVLLTH